MRKAKMPTEDSAGIQYMLAYSTGGAFSALWKWIELGMKESPEDLMRMFNNNIQL